MTEIINFVPARLKNVAVGGHVAGASDIIDDTLNKTQDVINGEADPSYNRCIVYARTPSGNYGYISRLGGTLSNFSLAINCYGIIVSK